MWSERPLEGVEVRVATDVAGEFDSVYSWHAQVSQHDARMVSAGQIQGLDSLDGLGNNLDDGSVEYQPKSAAHERFIVGDHDEPGCRGLAPRSEGIQTGGHVLVFVDVPPGGVPPAPFTVLDAAGSTTVKALP